MSDHNNIYNIMGKLNALTPSEQVAQPTQKIYESVEAKGSVLEGVKSVEQKLSEKYMGFKAVEKAAKKGGAENPAAVAASIGRKKYGKTAFQKAAAAGKKMGESQLDEGIMDSLKGVVAKLQALPMIQKNLAAAKAKLPQIIAAAQKSQSGKDLMANLGIDEQQAQVAEGLGKTIAWGSYAGAGASLIAMVADFAMRAYISMGKPSFEEMSSYQASGFLLLAGFAAVGAGAIALGTSKAIDSAKKMGEEACNECGMYECMCDHDHMQEERETLKTKKGTIYKGGKHGYDQDSDNKKFDAPKGDIFGRTTGEVPAGKKGTKVKGKDTHDTVDETITKKTSAGEIIHDFQKSKNPKFAGKSKEQRKNQALGAYYGMHPEKSKVKEGKLTVSKALMESVNFKKMMDECNMTLEEMLECMNQDIQAYKATGDMTDRLRDFMHLHNHVKKMEEAKVDPMAPQMPSGQDVLPQQSTLGKIGSTVKNALTGPGDEELLARLQQDSQPTTTVDEELNELAKLAGITDEGNAFTGKLASTPKDGEFELDGETYTDTSNVDEDEAGPVQMYQESTLEEMAKLAGIFQEGKDYDDTTFPEPPTYDNTPDEHVEGEDVLLKGGDGEVAGMEKKMNSMKPTWKNADNPLAEDKSLMKPATEFNFVKEMGRDLMQAYEGIKAK